MTEPSRADYRPTDTSPRPTFNRRRFVGGALAAALPLGLTGLGPGPVTAAPASTQTAQSEPVVVGGRRYDAYIPAATKPGQFYWYTCEFDAAWVVFKTYGYEVGLFEQLAAVGRDESVEPYARETSQGIVIHGGEVAEHWCGDYTKNFLARMRGPAMRKVFRAYGLRATPVVDRADIMGALRKGKLVWAKATVDFLPWTPATWVTPAGKRFPTPYTNDHAVVAIGYNRDVVVIRDVLGPTDTNWNRQYEYEVPWSTFLDSLGSHGFDALSVAPPALVTPGITLEGGTPGNFGPPTGRVPRLA